MHRQSGAHEVMISSENRWVLMHENRGEAEPNLDQLIDRMADVDMVLIEGFKSYPHSKLEIHRASQEKPLICDGDPSIVAVASDAPLPDLAVPVLPLDDIAAIAAFILEHCGLAPALAETTS